MIRMEQKIICKRNICANVLMLFTLMPMVSHAQDSEDSLESIIRTFSEAIKDPSKEEEFYDLFLHDSITWATIFVGKTREVMIKNGRYNPFYATSFKEFLEGVKGMNSQEKFYNVTIIQDQYYASINFDYTFQNDEEIQNWGKEYWTLIKVDGKWKITSVLWTTNFEDIEKSPFTGIPYLQD